MINYQWDGIKPEWNVQTGGEHFECWMPATFDIPEYDGYWFKMDTWSKDESILLLHNICPYTFLKCTECDLETLIKRLEGPSDLYISLMNIKEIFENSVISNQITDRHSPQAFVQWAQSKGFEIHEALRPLLHTSKLAPHELPAYLNRKNKFFAPELALAVEAWQAVFTGEHKPGNLTPKQRIVAYLKKHPTAKGNTNLIDRISKVCNPNKKNSRK